MLDKALSIIAPHLCYGCGEIGTAMCESCKYDIVSEPYVSCIVCQAPTIDGVCGSHRSPIDGAWILGMRDEGLGRLIDAFKFERARSLHRDLGEMLADVVPVLPEGTIVTSIPTVRAHVRERGYDHAALIAKDVAKHVGMPYRPLLLRVTNAKQRGANRKERFAQAKSAFALRTAELPDYILLVDDVITTGATLHFAAKLLKKAGVKTVYIAAIAKQPLDQS